MVIPSCECKIVVARCAGHVNNFSRDGNKVRQLEIDF